VCWQVSIAQNRPKKVIKKAARCQKRKNARVVTFDAHRKGRATRRKSKKCEGGGTRLGGGGEVMKWNSEAKPAEKHKIRTINEDNFWRLRGRERKGKGRKKEKGETLAGEEW